MNNTHFGRRKLCSANHALRSFSSLFHLRLVFEFISHRADNAKRWKVFQEVNSMVSFLTRELPVLLSQMIALFTLVISGLLVGKNQSGSAHHVSLCTVMGFLPRRG